MVAGGCERNKVIALQGTQDVRHLARLRLVRFRLLLLTWTPIKMRFLIAAPCSAVLTRAGRRTNGTLTPACFRPASNFENGMAQLDN